MNDNSGYDAYPPERTNSGLKKRLPKAIEQDTENGDYSWRKHKLAYYQGSRLSVLMYPSFSAA